MSERRERLMILENFLRDNGHDPDKIVQDIYDARKAIVGKMGDALKKGDHGWVDPEGRK